MKDEDGEQETVSVGSLAGEGELWLNFWASYCSPCVAELPLLDKIDGTEGRRVLLVSADAPGDMGRANEIAAERAPCLKRYFIATDCEETENAKMLSALVDLERLPIPTTLVFDSDGELKRVIRGPVEELSLIHI